jgi:hypothetical protein
VLIKYNIGLELFLKLILCYIGFYVVNKYKIMKKRD